jgi:large subunit ribosomal protein L28
MAKVCEICGKKPIVGSKISHSHRVTKRRFLPNIKRVRAKINDSVRYINVCTKCLKAGKVKKVI